MVVGLVAVHGREVCQTGLTGREQHVKIRGWERGRCLE